MLNLSGIWVPLVTPMQATDGGEPVPDLPALKRLVQRLARQGVAGFVACGSTGEAALLSADEQEAVLAAVLAALLEVKSDDAKAKAPLPVLMGLAGPQPAVVAQRAADLAHRHAVSGFLLTAPAYVRPPQAGIVRYFHTVAQASPVPIVAYDIPARTGVRIAPTTLMALAEHPRIVGLKDCSGQRDTAEAVLADGRLALLAGNDDELFDQLARGAAGGIVATAHLAAPGFVALQAAVQGGRLAEAQSLWMRLSPLVQAVFAEPNPMPLKAAMARLDWMAPDLRAPLQSAQAETTEQVLNALQAMPQTA